MERNIRLTQAGDSVDRVVRDLQAELGRTVIVKHANGQVDGYEHIGTVQVRANDAAYHLFAATA